MARFTQAGGSGSGEPGPQGPQGPAGENGNNGSNGSDGLDSLFLGTWDSVTEFLAVYQGGPVGLANGDWWAFVKDNANPNKIYVVREDPLSATGWVIDDNEHFDLPAGPQGDPGTPGADGSDGVAGADGQDGAPGADGLDGADGTTPFTLIGAYDNGASYNLGIAVYYNGGTYVRTGNPLNPGYPPEPGAINASWTPIAEKGEDAPVGTGANGEVTRYSPNFQATGLTFTGASGTYPTYNSHYVKNGRMVSFNIEVNMSTVTNFGTGQYKLQLPFTPQFGFNHFSGWIWADPNVDPDTGTGHTILNADTAGVTDVLDLHYLKQGGGANSPIREGLFLQGTPVTLSTISKIYINGTYITAE